MAQRQYRTEFVYNGETFRRRGDAFVGSRGTVIGRRAGEKLRGRPLPPPSGRRWVDKGTNPVSHRQTLQYGPSDRPLTRADFLARKLRSLGLPGSTQIQVAMLADWVEYRFETAIDTPAGPLHWISTVPSIAHLDALIYKTRGNMDKLAQELFGKEPREGAVYAVAIGLPRQK